MDYRRTSAPTPVAASVKIMMAVGGELDYKVYHRDVAQVFTKANLHCVVYMKLPGERGELSGTLCVSRKLGVA